MKLESKRCCDFCNRHPELDGYKQYVWMFNRQVIPAGTDLDLFEGLLQFPEWFACVSCHKLIVKQDLLGLVNANKDIKNEKQRKYFTQVYSALLGNMTRN